MAFLKGIFKGKEQGKKEEASQSEALEKGLERTKSSFFDKVKRFALAKSEIDDDTLDEIEMALISADIGVETSVRIIEQLKKRIEREKYLDSGEIFSTLKHEVSALLEQNGRKEKLSAVEKQNERPYVMLVVGVNGVGKTTTIGKLAAQFKKQGKKVILGAADTFRAAAVQQLDVWAERAGAGIVKQEMGADPASVAFDAVSSAKAQGADVVIIDTAGRLHNKVNLMNELTKIRRVIEKVIPEAPHEVLLVLDGSTGQNAFEQAKQFAAATDITALAVTKLDGSAKGGVVIGISEQMNIPVKYIGVGEQVDDLQEFDARLFVDTFFKD